MQYRTLKVYFIIFLQAKNHHHHHELSSWFLYPFCSSVTPEDWQSFSNENILKAERDRKNAADLRAMVDSLLETTANDMQQQVDETNLAFSKRIRETDVTKGKLETHLAKVSADDSVNGPIHKRANHVPKAMILDHDSDPFLIWRPDFTHCESKALSIRLLKCKKGHLGSRSALKAWFWGLVNAKLFRNVIHACAFWKCALKPCMGQSVQ